MRKKACSIAKIIIEGDDCDVVYAVKSNGTLVLPKKKPRNQIDMKNAFLKYAYELDPKNSTVNGPMFPIPKIKTFIDKPFNESNLNQISSENQLLPSITETTNLGKEDDFDDFDDSSYFSRASQTNVEIF
ncbi:hypothetical protein TVAG_187720 [Trichomonas vaginalis G3]|uniref:Uncharacterized protein n=1 Tax=Trichomonas vaginalis (strain ATCC PRA-98 / G3) TaxID=412133 RepID=A2DUZ4_TRIV3|nr:hypothetical protein TVAGG3_0939910 [Trichomonas vaginalis G3]EAY15721.1 hypothetical protein TVAG_187720 [Trichomonas vaginalis G3]KAI5486468.1 hypothetical protein TVAGG3_0939910 [Trichomonas vaginalis G3]|eukprot:XP_001327944.1 hypothetical protein [Trichomonas vaginalis G3]